MVIKIALPNPNESDGIKQFLRQLELSVHHAQKAIEEEEKSNGPETITGEEAYAIFRFPLIDLYEREQDGQGFVKVHVDEEATNMQEIEIKINT